MDLVIKNATVLSESGVYEAAIGVTDGTIATISSPAAAPDARETLDASGKLVMPGVIDVHVHMELPVSGTVSSDDFASGTVAAAFGGVTTIIDFATQERGESLLKAVDRRRRVAQAGVAIDYGLHCAITDWGPKTRREMKRIVASGVTSFKLFMAYDERGWSADDGMLYEVFEEAASLGAVAGVHAENPRLIRTLTRRALATGRKGAYLHALSRPNFTESEAVARAIYLASLSNARIYIFHLSTREGCEVIEEWQARGYPVAAETCPQFLTLTNEIYKRRNGHLYATCPPVRTEEDNRYLWEALENGMVQVVSTDHCAFTRKQKARWRGDFRKIPCGLPGVETLLPVMFTEGFIAGRISSATLVETLCGNPARLFGLYPRKGTIRVGSDADLLIIDPAATKRITAARLHMNCDFSPYQGRDLNGFPMMTILRGKIIQREGRFLGRRGDGVFLERTVEQGGCLGAE
jgi:dihydropyrimidinase